MRLYHLMSGYTYACSVMKATLQEIPSFKLLGADVDIRSGNITVAEGCHEVAENLALSFCVSTLFALCDPSSKNMANDGDSNNMDGMVNDSSNKEDARNGDVNKISEAMCNDHVMLGAVGYGQPIPSNVWLQWVAQNNVCACTCQHKKQ